MLYGRSVLQSGLRDENDARRLLVTGSPSKILSLHNHIKAADDEWGMAGVANSPHVRGLLTLFEGSGERAYVQSSSTQLQVADWVAATKANGFKIYPVLRATSFSYQARDFDPQGYPEDRKLIPSDNNDYYGRLRLLYTSRHCPWSPSDFDRFTVIGASGYTQRRETNYTKAPQLDGEPRIIRADIPKHREACQLAMVLAGNIVVPLTPPLPSQTEDYDSDDDADADISSNTSAIGS